MSSRRPTRQQRQARRTMNVATISAAIATLFAFATGAAAVHVDHARMAAGLVSSDGAFELLSGCALIGAFIAIFAANAALDAWAAS